MEAIETGPTRSQIQIRRITSWLGALPWKDADADLLMTLVSDILEMSCPYGVALISTSEPKTYRPTPRGLAGLREALANRRAEMLDISTRPQPNLNSLIPTSSFSAMVRLFESVSPTDKISPIAAGMVGIVVEPADESVVPAVTARFVDFVTRWFEPLGALSAFVSFDGKEDGTVIRDVPLQTALESERHVTPLLSYPPLQVYARGVFWGNGLGPSLCARLGGVERVLAEAPVPIARRLGDGVWLQFAGTPPPDPVQLAHLADYLSPLVAWTPDDTYALDRKYLAANQPMEAVLSVSPIRLPSIPPKEDSAKKSRVPVRWLPDAREDTAAGLNVYLATPPSADERAELEALVASWYQRGFEGGFGGVGFHSVRGPSVDGSVLRWDVDLGSAHPRRAIEGLVDQLETSTLPVAQLVIGTETQG